jgi:histidinol-phosphatase (PHP family)
LYDVLLSKLIKNNICLEVNTKRMNQEIAYENLTTIYKKYKQLGGKYVTIGSDAHSEIAIGGFFETTVKLIEEIGLNIVYFKERKMIR